MCSSSGCGNVGTRVVEYLRALNQHVVAVETAPDPVLVELSSRREIDLITADATRDATLDLCNIPHARAIIAVTNSDTANLEIALGARSRNAGVPVVVRVQDHTFARSINKHFAAIPTFSTAEIAAEVFALISCFPKTRGRVELGAVAYRVAEWPQGKDPKPLVQDGCVPLGVWQAGAFRHVDGFDSITDQDRLLYLVPMRS